MKQRIFLIFLILSLLLCFGCSAEPDEPERSTYRAITMDEAIALMEREEDYILLDVRTQEEFDEGHIPNAICIPNESIAVEQHPSLPDLDQLILVYCRSGNRSKQAAGKLAMAGYTNVVEFGGIIDWPGAIVQE